MELLSGLGFNIQVVRPSAASIVGALQTLQNVEMKIRCLLHSQSNSVAEMICIIQCEAILRSSKFSGDGPTDALA
jgi:hypothetical protein